MRRKIEIYVNTTPWGCSERRRPSSPPLWTSDQIRRVARYSELKARRRNRQKMKGNNSQSEFSLWLITPFTRLLPLNLNLTKKLHVFPRGNFVEVRVIKLNVGWILWGHILLKYSISKFSIILSTGLRNSQRCIYYSISAYSFLNKSVIFRGSRHLNCTLSKSFDAYSCVLWSSCMIFRVLAPQ